MVSSFIQCVWFVSNLDVPSDIKFIIMFKIRRVFEQESKVKQSLGQKKMEWLIFFPQ